MLVQIGDGYRARLLLKMIEEGKLDLGEIWIDELDLEWI